MSIEGVTTEQMAARIKWAEWLESGHKQGSGRLGDAESGYCCLAGACLALGVEFDPEDGVLPMKAREMLGLKNGNPVLAARHPATGHSATNLNDVQRLTFPQIARGVRRVLIEGGELPTVKELREAAAG